MLTLEFPNRASIAASLARSSPTTISAGLALLGQRGGYLCGRMNAWGRSEWPAVLRFDFCTQYVRLCTAGCGPAHSPQWPRICCDRRGAPEIPRRYNGPRSRHLGTSCATEHRRICPFHGTRLGQGTMCCSTSPGITSPRSSGWTLTARIPAERRAAVLAHWDQVFRNDREGDDGSDCRSGCVKTRFCT